MNLLMFTIELLKQWDEGKLTRLEVAKKIGDWHREEARAKADEARIDELESKLMDLGVCPECLVDPGQDCGAHK